MGSSFLTDLLCLATISSVRRLRLVRPTRSGSHRRTVQLFRRYRRWCDQRRLELHRRGKQRHPETQAQAHYVHSPLYFDTSHYNFQTPYFYPHQHFYQHRAHLNQSSYHVPYNDHLDDYFVCCTNELELSRSGQYLQYKRGDPEPREYSDGGYGMISC